MGIVSLLIGLYHVLLLVGPILATYLTISSNSESVTVILLWAFSYLRGLGYDSITDLYSEEASIYISLIAAIKTTHYIDFSQTGGLVAWGIVLCAELSYFALRRVPKVGDFIAIHRYKHIATSGNPLNAPPWKDLGVIVFLAVALNALRAILYATVFTIPSSIDSSALNQYSYSVSQTTYAIDYRGIYTALVELAVVIPLCTRLLKLSDYGLQTDVWKTGLGVYFIYIYLQVCTLVPLFTGSGNGNTAQVSVTAVTCVLMLVALIWVAARASETKDATGHSPVFGTLGKPIITGIEDLIEVAFNPGVVRVFFVVLVSLVAYTFTSPWYTTEVQFRHAYKSIACPMVQFFDEEVGFFYKLTSDPDLQLAMLPIAVDITSIRAKLRLVGVALYPDAAMVCYGKFFTFMPSKDIDITLFMLPMFIPAIFVATSVFPESERVMQTPMFWAISMSTVILSLCMSQIAAGASAMFWYIVDRESTYSRTYTAEGVIAILAMIALIIQCMAMIREQFNDNKTPEEELKEVSQAAGALVQKKNEGAASRAVGKLGSIAVSIAQAGASDLLGIPRNIEQLFLSNPGTLMAVTGFAILLYTVVYAPIPFDAVVVSKQTFIKTPPWLVPTPFDAFANSPVSIVKIIGKKAMLVLQLVGVAEFVFNQIPSFHFEIPYVVNIDVSIGRLLGGGVDVLRRLIETAFDEVSKLVVPLLFKNLPKVGDLDIGHILERFDSILLTLPNLDGLSINPLAALDLSSLGTSLRIPTWLPTLGAIFVVGFLAILVASLFIDRLKFVRTSYASLFSGLSFSTFMLAARIYTDLSLLSFQIEVVPNRSATMYGVSFALMISGFILLYFAPEVKWSEYRGNAQAGVAGKIGGSKKARSSPHPVEQQKLLQPSKGRSIPPIHTTYRNTQNGSHTTDDDEEA